MYIYIKFTHRHTHTHTHMYVYINININIYIYIYIYVHAFIFVSTNLYGPEASQPHAQARGKGSCLSPMAVRVEEERSRGVRGFRVWALGVQYLGLCELDL